MKVTLEYDNLEDAMSAMKGGDWKLVVWRLDQQLRNRIKYSDKDEPELQGFRDLLSELLNDYNLILE